MPTNLAPPPVGQTDWDYVLKEWFNQLYKTVGGSSGQVPWSNINTSGSNITDIQFREHNNLQNIQGGILGENYHLSESELSFVRNSPIAILMGVYE